MRFRELKKHKKQKVSQEEKTIPYATTPDRIKAFITDMFMIYTPILYIITYVFMNGKDDFQSSQIAPFIGVTLYGIVYAILLAKLGQTPGKKAYNIKVVDQKTHQNISFFRALLRFVVFLFSATIVFGLIVPFFRKDNLTLHDIVAKTVVLQVKESV